MNNLNDSILNDSILNDINLKVDILENKLKNDIKDINGAKKLINLSVELHQHVIKLIQKESKKNKLLESKKQNWDFWETLENETKNKVESVYFDLKNKYYDLHWDLHGFNSY